MKNEDYQALYFHAFNSITKLIEHAQAIQQELEEKYLELEEGREE